MASYIIRTEKNLHNFCNLILSQQNMMLHIKEKIHFKKSVHLLDCNWLFQISNFVSSGISVTDFNSLL